MATYECPTCGWEYEESGTDDDTITVVCKGDCREDDDVDSAMQVFEQA